MTPEESLEDVSAAMGGTEGEQVSQQPSTNAEGLVTSVAPPSSIETRPKVVSESSNPDVLSGGHIMTREASREDALAATQHFFHTEPERRSATEVPVTTMTGVSPTDTPPTTSAPKIERPEPSPVGTIPYSGMPPRPTATATLSPRTWVQRISEGQIERTTTG